MGRVLYQTKGSANEYSKYGFSVYIGCSVCCEYCYNKKGITKGTLGGNEVKIKKTLWNPKTNRPDEKYALEKFQKELLDNIYDLRKHGVFFSFVTDPMLPETCKVTMAAIGVCQINKVPVKILTKMGTEAAIEFNAQADMFGWDKNLIAYGVTITGFDNLEPNAPGNADRGKAVVYMKHHGFKTFVSFEPIIDFDVTFKFIEVLEEVCDLMKIGLKSGGKYKRVDAQTFVERIIDMETTSKIYLKESLQKLSKYTNEELDDRFVGRSYNMFTGNI